MYKFATLKIFVTPFFCLLCPPLGELRIPRRTAARTHFVAINNGARQFCERLSRKFELVERSTWEQFVFLQFQKNFSAEFKTNISYSLLLQWFLWTFSGIYIISVKANTTNFSQNYQQFFFLLDSIFFKQYGLLMRECTKKIFTNNEIGTFHFIVE